MKASTWSTTVQVHVARKPRQNRLIVRKLLPCSIMHMPMMTPAKQCTGGVLQVATQERSPLCAESIRVEQSR